MAAKKQIKSLKSLANTSKGEIHHMVIRPARNSAGKMGFITETHRKPSKQMQMQADAQGRYLPDSMQDQPDTAHEDGNDMLDHVGNQLAIAPEDNDGDGDDEQGPPQ